MLKSCIIGAILLFADPWPHIASADPLKSLAESSNLDAIVHIGASVREIYSLSLVPQDWSVANAGPPPEQVLREAYFGREASMNCTDAALAFLSMRRLIDADLGVEEDTQFYLLRGYVEACLTPLDSVSDPLGTYSGAVPENASTLIFLLGEEGLRRLRSSIVFTPQGAGLLCSGTLVWLEGASGKKLNLLTAAHCLGSIRRARESSSRLVRLDVSRSIEFIDLAGNSLVLRLNLGDSYVDYDGFGDDLAAIEIEGDFDSDFIGVKLASVQPDAWDNIYIVGQNRYLAEFRSMRFYRSNGVIGLPPEEATVIAMEPGCRAFGQAGYILLHNCQTVSGMSGAGVFVYGDNELQFIGVHSGFREAFAGHGGDLDELQQVLTGSRAENYATLLGRRSQ